MAHVQCPFVTSEGQQPLQERSDALNGGKAPFRLALLSCCTCPLSSNSPSTLLATLFPLGGGGSRTIAFSFCALGLLGSLMGCQLATEGKEGREAGVFTAWQRLQGPV